VRCVLSAPRLGGLQDAHFRRYSELRCDLLSEPAWCSLVLDNNNRKKMCEVEGCDQRGYGVDRIRHR
jgi:hypothetical protein